MSLNTTIPTLLTAGEPSSEAGHGHNVGIQIRSCQECSRRKVRCDRHVPCRHCVRTSADCVYPRFRKRPVRRRVTIDIPNGLWPSSGISNPNPSPSTFSKNQNLPQSTDNSEEPNWLVRDQFRSRYIGNTFWASMSRDIAEMRDVLDESSANESSDTDNEEDAGVLSDDNTSSISLEDKSEEGDYQHYGVYAPTSNTERRKHNGECLFMFRPANSGSHALRPLYPTESQLLAILDVFSESVDPVAKIFHRETIRSVVLNPLNKSQQLDRAGEAVLFSVFFAALTSLNAYDCQRLFGEDLDLLLSRYRTVVEQSLARSRFLQSQNFNVLSALVLFLLTVRRHDTSRFVSSLLGIAIRNAQAMGMHRDGTTFQLTPFQTEMRRRVWWHISVLDLRCSEDHGLDPTILDCSHDTKFPSNVNDKDLSIDMTSPPLIQSGLSDMSFCLVRFEVCVAIRKLHYRDPLLRYGGLRSQPEISKYDVVATIEKSFNEHYIQKADVTNAVHWMSATWAKMMLAKMWLTVCVPDTVGKPDTPERRNGSWQLAFSKAIEMLQLLDLLETSPRAARWQWLFLTHTQWHVIVFVLAFICQNPQDDRAGHAWGLVQKIYARWTGTSSIRKGMLWKPLRQLLQKAEKTRNEPSRQSELTKVGPITSVAEIDPTSQTFTQGPRTLLDHQEPQTQVLDISDSNSPVRKDSSQPSMELNAAFGIEEELNNWWQWDWMAITGDSQPDVTSGDDDVSNQIDQNGPTELFAQDLLNKL